MYHTRPPPALQLSRSSWSLDVVGAVDDRHRIATAISIQDGILGRASEDGELSCLRNVYTIANVEPDMSRVQ